LYYFHRFSLVRRGTSLKIGSHKVKNNDESIKNLIYTVAFIDEPLLKILELMAIAKPAKYKASPRGKMPDRTFSEQKIIEKFNS